MRFLHFFLGLAALAACLAPASRAELPRRQAPAKAAPSIAPRPDINDPENLLHLDLSTGGRVTILLRPDAAPAHVERVKLLVRRGFYDGLIFHRVIEGFMAQTGDPQGTGEGGSDLPDLKAEFNNLPHMRGAVSMARTQEPDSANSQFFITFAPVLRLDRQYTVFGRVIAGMEWVDAIPRGEPPVNPARILQASIAADKKPPPVFPKPAASLPADLPPSTLPPAPSPRP
ncbi:peptidylprolyl isomerase [Thermaurantiacus sp.]